MSFHSVHFFCFLALALSAVAVSPIQRRPLVLLASSWIFYAWQAPLGLAFLFAVIGLTWWLSLQLKNRPQTMWLVIDVVAKLGLLILARLLLPSWSENWIVPVGLIFYSFQSFGYLMDVYRNSSAFISSLTQLALFVSFFPTVMSGPIERSSRLVPQLNGETIRPEHNWNRASAWREIGSGLFKKLVIADVLWIFLGPVFRNPGALGGIGLFLAILLARLMIYADFSAYSNLARGVAGLFGIEISRNFNQPFRSTSLIDYWRRWHISLHDWMKDYVFLPLANSSAGKRAGMPVALFATFLLMGLWHQVSWTFFAVGVWHGLFMALDLATRDSRAEILSRWGADRFPRLRDNVLRIITLLCFVLPPTLFFMANSIGDVQLMLRRLIDGVWWMNSSEPELSLWQRLTSSAAMTFQNVITQLGSQSPDRQALLVRSLLFLMGWWVFSGFDLWSKFESFIDRSSWPIRYLIYVLWFLALVIWGETWGGARFVYFAFF